MITAEQYNSRFDFLVEPTTLELNLNPVHLILSSSIRHSHTFRLYAEILRQSGCEASFLPFEVSADDEPRLKRLFDKFRSSPTLETIMVSNPFKQRVYSFVDHITDRAKALGGINMITKTSSGICGDNLDGLAFVKGLQDIDGINLRSQSIAFIGCGGVSSAVSITLATTLQKIGLIDIDANKAAALKNAFLPLNSAVEILDLSEKSSLLGYNVIYDGTGLGKLGQSPISSDHVTNSSFIYRCRLHSGGHAFSGTRQKQRDRNREWFEPHACLDLSSLQYHYRKDDRPEASPLHLYGSKKIPIKKAHRKVGF